MNTKKVLIIVLSVVLIFAAVAAAAWIIYDLTADRSGWVTDEGTYYLDRSGDPVTGWQEIDGNRYYFFPDGLMADGWQEIDECRFYFGHDGAMVTLWQTLDGCRHYFGHDGVQRSGWQQIDGSTVFLHPESGLFTGWQYIDGQTYYFDGDGAMVTGSVVLEGLERLFRDDGTLVTGWNDGSYYSNEGVIATGWQQIDGKRYLFDENGAPFTGWLEEGGYSYYLLEDGSAATGPLELDGRTYYFNHNGIHILLVNPWNYIPEDYTVELVASEGGYRVSTECYDALTAMLGDCRAAGLTPLLISGYRSYWDQVAMYNEKVSEYGSKYAGQIVAVPNTSEHQLGLAVDIVSSGDKTLNSSQANTRVQKWLMEHCWEYGFILRYPEGTTDITGIIYEPWHYRYVGQEIALELKDLGITLEEYLGAVNTGS